VSKRDNLGWVGVIRSIDTGSDSAIVWWLNDYQRNKDGRIIKDSRGQKVEKLSRESLSSLKIIQEKAVL
jgi:hypothetical protein